MKESNPLDSGGNKSKPRIPGFQEKHDKFLQSLPVADSYTPPKIAAELAAKKVKETLAAMRRKNKK